MTDAITPATSNKSNDMLARAQVLIGTPPAKSTGSVRVSGKSLKYNSEVGFIPVYNDKRELQAAVGYTSYALTGDKAKSKRPLLFAFNGGPGSSSVWLHLGALGPKRVVVNDDGSAPAPPYGVEDNALTWLQFADLVMIDPVRTGFSVSASEEAEKKQLSLVGDIAYLSEAIRQYLQQTKNNGRPLYLCGESYGTTRGAGIADTLADNGVTLSGIILVSLAMDFQSFVFAPRNDLPFQTFLAAFAATAWYHGKAKRKDFTQLIAEVDDYASGDMATALYKGQRLSEKEKSKAATTIAEFTGLSSSLVLANNLRIDAQTFFTELLRGRGQIVGRLDSRTLLPMGQKQDKVMPFDPAWTGIAGPYAAAMANYLRDDLNVSLDARYMISSPLYMTWDYSDRGGGLVNDEDGKGNNFATTSTRLASAMRKLPHLRVLVVNGYFDLATPFSAADYQMAQLNIDAKSYDRITKKYYQGGHMMYTKQSELKQLFSDVKAWVK
jgi:carboxypeptidase C (cathepsin A)